MRKLFRGALVLALLTCPAWAGAQATNPDSASTTAPSEEEQLLPYRGTSITYENSFTAISLNPDYEPDYNPSYLMTWAFSPRYYLYDTLSARLGFSVDLELTDSDSTQQLYEPWVSDISLGFIYSTFYTIPVVELKLGGGVTFGFPTSKLSQARTLYLSLAPSLSIRRSFDVLGGLQLSYGFKYTKNFNQYSGMVTEDEQFPCTSSVENQTECFNMGMRNPSMSFSNTFEASIYWLDRLYTTLSFGMTNTLLYPVADAQVETLAGAVDVPASEDNTDMRGSLGYMLEVGYDAWDFLSFALGVSTVTAQLADDGSYRPPFINRFSAIYFDISLSIDGLVTTIEDLGEDGGEDTASSADVGAVAAR
ncbi:MAG: hypothetical protein HY905_24975 [Deltaproteobacteria bacterium]|nr:hypothetical protein [Deltaproteobacteria bacterium]